MFKTFLYLEVIEVGRYEITFAQLSSTNITLVNVSERKKHIYIFSLKTVFK
jgi:hypothetical protein